MSLALIHNLKGKWGRLIHNLCNIGSLINGRCHNKYIVEFFMYYNIIPCLLYLMKNHSTFSKYFTRCLWIKYVHKMMTIKLISLFIGVVCLQTSLIGNPFWSIYVSTGCTQSAANNLYRVVSLASCSNQAFLNT